MSLILREIESSASTGGVLRLLGQGSARTRTYAELLEDGDRVAAGLRSIGVEPGDRVGALASTSFEFVAACLGIWRAGGVLVPLALPTKLGSREEWTKRTDRIAHNARLKTVLFAQADPPLGTNLSPLPIEELRGHWNEESVIDRNDVALVQFTSGSTSTPRGVEISHRALMAHFRAQEERAPLVPDKHHYLNWLPLYHDLGLVAGLFRCLVRGVTATLMPTGLFLERPVRWVEEMSAWQASHTSAPNVAYALAARALERWDGGPLDLSSWVRAGCGGEPVDAPTLQRFAAVAEKYSFDPAALAPGYGLAEATCVVTGFPDGSGLMVDIVDRRPLAGGHAEACEPGTRDATSFVSVGPPLPGILLRIASPSGSSLPERAVGEVWLGGPTVMEGYDDPTASATALEGGWLRTGDLGYLSSGQLFLTGRVKELVIVGGQNFYPVDIERVAEQTTGVRPGACVAFSLPSAEGEALIVAAETKLESDQLDACREDIRRRVWRTIGVGPRDVVLTKPGTIPKTTSGKLQRNLVREMYESGKLVGIESEKASR